MKTTFSLVAVVLLALGMTACSGGSSSGAIPQTVQAGASVSTLQSEINALKAQLAKNQNTSNSQEKKENSESVSVQDNLVSSEETLAQVMTNYTFTPLSNDEKESILTSINNGSEIENSCANQGKKINACIGANANIENGSVIYTDKLSYAGYAVVRNADATAGQNSAPMNQYIAMAKTATTNKDAVIDATYKGGVTYTNNNLATIISKQNSGGYIAEVTLNVKDQNVSGVIESTMENINITRVQEQKIPKELVTLKETAITFENGVVGFKGEALFNYGQGFLSNSAGVGTVGEGLYQGVFAGENAEEVVGTFHTHSTDKQDSVQGAFVGARQ